MYCFILNIQLEEEKRELLILRRHYDMNIEDIIIVILRHKKYIHIRMTKELYTGVQKKVSTKKKSIKKVIKNKKIS